MPIPNYHLTFRSGPNPGKVYPLEKQEIFIGRDLSNDIPVPDPEISRRHARILLQPDGIYIEDLGSTNGTFLRGMRISSPQALHVGDVITLAENIVMLLEADAYDPDATVVGGQAYTVAANVQPPTPPQPAYQPKPPQPAPQQAVPQYTPHQHSLFNLLSNMQHLKNLLTCRQPLPQRLFTAAKHLLRPKSAWLPG